VCLDTITEFTDTGDWNYHSTPPLKSFYVASYCTPEKAGLVGSLFLFVFFFVFLSSSASCYFKLSLQGRLTQIKKAKYKNNKNKKQADNK